MKKFFLLAAILSTATFLASCSDGAGDTAQVAAVDARLAANGNTGKDLFIALEDESFNFPTGVAAFGTAGATTVTINPPAAAGRNPTFTITSGGRTATGTLAFGPGCSFRVTDSTFGPASPLADGSVVDVADCGVQLDTAGQSADEVARDIIAMLFLNTDDSTGSIVNVAIDSSGRISVNGRFVGTVTLRPVTGAA